MTSNPEPAIRVDVDPLNPGEFFACCGLLELADRLWAGAEGWFEGDSFCATTGTTSAILEALTAEPAEEILHVAGGVPVKALLAPLRLNLGTDAGHVTLDAWMTIRRDRGQVVATANPPWNFWSGQQTSHRTWTSLRAALRAQLAQALPASPGFFNERVPLSGRFGFDPGPAWTALDAGFSPNEQRIDVVSSPAVELLAAVGIQRFRPRVSDDRATFQYVTWGRPLPPCLAAAAASGSWICDPSVRFRGRVLSRGSYAALGYSTCLEGDVYD